MLMVWKIRPSKDINSFKIDIQVNSIPIKIPARVFVDKEKIILKFI